MLRADFPNFSVDLPPGWRDITAEVEAENPPATVARSDGVGALQFTVVLYLSGPGPRGDVEVLNDFMHEFARSRGLISPSNVVSESSPRALVAASFRWDEDYVRVWYLSESGNFAFVTYTCAQGNFNSRELSEAEAIVRSLVFGEPVD